MYFHANVDVKWCVVGDFFHLEGKVLITFVFIAAEMSIIIQTCKCS
jgi:hypothetical protein